MFQFTKLIRSNRKIGNIFKIRHRSGAAKFIGIPTEDVSIANPLESFEDVLLRRESEVKRSIVVKIDSPNLSSSVYNYCKQFGGIKNAIAYSLKDERHFLLIEYEFEEAVTEAHKHCGYPTNKSALINHYLTLRTSKLKDSYSADAPIQFSHVEEPPIVDILKNAKSIDEQCLLLYKHTCINDTLTRVKFIGAMQTQRILNFFMSSIFPNARVYPFGSTLNGYGRMGSDLDIALRYDSQMDASQNEDSPLKFHTRFYEKNEEFKRVVGRQVRCMAALIDQYLPASNKIRHVAGAKVPLVTYYDTNIPCSVDLSVNNLNGFSDTQVMYTLGVLDPRVRPFIFLVRRWGREFKITRHGRGDRFTNFQLTYIALSFLQNLTEPVIPTYNEMLEMMKHKSKNPLFILDLNQIQFQSKNACSVFELFCQFLEYYRSFDFKNRAISLRKTGAIDKWIATPLILDNLFDNDLLIGDNISETELHTMKIMMDEALSEFDNINLEPDGSENWGLLGLLMHLKP